MHHDKPSERQIAASFFARQFAEIQQFLEVMDRHLSINQPRAVRALHRVSFLGRVGGRDLADEVLEEIVDRDEPFDVAVLVDDERDVRPGFLEHLEQAKCGNRAGHEQRRLCRVGQVQWPATHATCQQVLLFHHADDVVQAAPRNRKARMRRRHDLFHRLFRWRVHVKPHDVVTRFHERHHRAIAQSEQASDRFMLRFFDEAGFGALFHDDFDFFFRDQRFLRRPDAERAQDHAGRCVQDGHDGRAHPGERHHRLCECAGEPLRAVQRNLLRHELSNDERDVGDGADDGHERDHVSIRREPRNPVQIRLDAE